MGSSANLIKVANPVRMNLQLSDGEQSLPRIVKAIIRNNNGTFIQENNLTHVGGGLFKDSSFIMPEIDELTVQYMVYEMDGITLDPSYTTDVDVFTRSDKVVAGGSSTGNIDDEFVVMYNEEPEYIVEVNDENN
jgi:hypothetical protein